MRSPAMPCRGTLAALSLILGMVAPAAGARSIGRLYAVTGDVQLVREGVLPMRALSFSEVQAGDVLKIPDGARANVVYWTGARWRADGMASVRCDTSGLRRLSGKSPEPTTRLQVPPLLVRSVLTPRATAVVVRGGDVPPGPSHPRPSGAVPGPGCTLQWDFVAGETEAQTAGCKLRVRVWQRERDPLVKSDLPATAREFELPRKVCAPGKWYQWSVTLVGPGEVDRSCGGAYRVVMPSELADIEKLKREVEPLREKSPRDPVPDLLLARAYEQVGMWREASAAYTRALENAEDADAREALGGMIRDLGEW